MSLRSRALTYAALGALVALGAWPVAAEPDPAEPEAAEPEAVEPAAAEEEEADAGGSAGPENIGGLEAWYRIESLHASHNDGDAVVAWKDSSGNGHHLQADLKGTKPMFVTKQLNEKPAVHVRKAVTLKVFRPYNLDDHTIFLVIRSEYTSRALFRSETDPRKGVLLRNEARFHQYQNGGNDFVYPYNKPVPMDKGFAIVVLAREDGLLGCFIDGRDLSSSTRFSEVIRVGTLFQLEHTLHAKSDGEGLHLAEMIVFNRYLPDAERNFVTSYLGEKFAIPVDFDAPPPTEEESAPEPEPPPTPPPGRDAAQVWVRSHDRSNLNVGAVALSWNDPVKVEPPFSLREEADRKRIYCERDDTRAELYVSAPVQLSQAQAGLRLLVFAKGGYLPDEASLVYGPEGEKRATAELRATIELDAGEFIEIVAAAEEAAGKGGEIRLQESGATLSLTLVGAAAPPAAGEPEAAEP